VDPEQTVKLVLTGLALTDQCVPVQQDTGETLWLDAQEVNVSMTVNALSTKLALITTADLHVRMYVGRMQNVKQGTMEQFAPVHQDLLETHLLHAGSQEDPRPMWSDSPGSGAILTPTSYCSLKTKREFYVEKCTF